VHRGLQELTAEITRCAGELTQELNRAPSVAELAARSGRTEEEVLEALDCASAYAAESLDAPTAEDRTLGDGLGGDDPALVDVELHESLGPALATLAPRERRILQLRFYGNHTQSEIAAELGISQMHVSRLLTRALTWLREAMLNDVLPPWEGTDLPDHYGLELTSRRHDGVLIVRTRGELDRDTSGRLRAALHDAVAARPERVIVDLVDVPLVDAAGVAALLDAASAARLADIGLRLTGARPYVLHVFKVSGLAELLSGNKCR
jgi:RNA polymerase sigma-B factor